MSIRSHITLSEFLTLWNEAEYDVKQFSDQGGRYPQRPKAEDSLRYMKPEFNNCSIILSNIYIFLTTLPLRGISSKTFLVSRHGLFFDVENP